MGMIACVVGATGLVGNEVLALLSEDQSVDAVHVMTRRALRTELTEIGRAHV